MDETSTIEEELQEVLRRRAPFPGAVLTDFYLVTEWMDTEGAIWLTDSQSDMTAWKREGMINYALNNLGEAVHEDEDGD